MANNIISIVILANATGAKRGFAETSAAAEMTGKKISKMSDGINKMTAPAIAALAGIGLGAFKAAQMASELSDSMDATRVIFGPATDAVVKFAQGAAVNFGLSTQAALTAAGTFGTLGKSAGLQGPALSDFSNKFVGLAGDLASFKGGSADEAVLAVGAAMRGEMEPIRRYGILLDDATLRTQALKMGLIKSVKEALTPQQKALAASASIMAQASDATGDFARTSDSAKNLQMTLKAELQNTATTLGTSLLPIMVSVTHALSSMADWIGKNQTAFKWIAGTIAALAAIIITISVAMKIYAAAQWLANLAILSCPVTWIILGILAIIAVIVLIATKTTWFQSAWRVVWTAVKAAFAATVNFLKAMGQAFVTGFVAIWQGIVRIVQIVENFRNAVIARVSSAISWLLNAGRAMVTGFINAVVSTFARVVSFVASWRSRVLGILSGAAGWLLGVGQSLISGLVNGISNAWGAVTSKISSLVGSIPSAIKKLLGIGSPSKVTHKLGGWITRGLANGVTSQIPALRKALRTVTKTVLTGLPTNAGTVGTLAVTGSGAGVAGAQVVNLNVNVPPSTDPAEVGRQVVKALRAYETGTGRRVLVAATP